MDTSFSFDVRSFTLSGALPPAFGYYDVCWVDGLRPPCGLSCGQSSHVVRPCSVTRQVTLKGAIKLLLQVLPIVRVSSPSATAGDAWTLISRCGPSRFRPCFRLILVLTKPMLTGLTYRGLSPHKFTPVPGVHQSLHLTAWAWRPMLPVSSTLDEC